METEHPSTSIDPGLVKIYEDLADEEETVRVKAAHSLLLNHISNADANQNHRTLTRLFRGLCSGRKAARLGFAIALTEALVQLNMQRGEEPDDVSFADTIINLLERSTKPDSNTSGQDERDHYFGRVFGCEAIMRSGILFSTEHLAEWDRLLDAICTIALQKPWLRQTCGWALYTTVMSALVSNSQQQYAIRILEKLSEHKLIRTPEGLVLWIAIRDLHPKSKFPKHVWNHDNPFHPKNLPTLANVLKDAKLDSSDGAELGVQGSASWSANLHFAWDVVLSELLKEGSDQDLQQKNHFREFWQAAVDQALFAPSNSKERKQWGLLVMQKTLKIAPPGLVEAIYSRNAVSCLVQSFKASDRYLQRSAQLVIQTLQECITQQPSQADKHILGLLKATDMADIDQETRTKTIETLLATAGAEAMVMLAFGLDHELEQQDPSNPVKTVKRRKDILNHESKIVSQQIHRALTQGEPLNEALLQTCLRSWTKIMSSKALHDEPVRALATEKTRLALEQVLKLGGEGRLFMLGQIGEIYNNNPVESLEAEASIADFVNAGWKRFRKLRKETNVRLESKSEVDEIKSLSNTEGNKAAKTEGLALLYGLILFEIYSGDTEAIQILQELLELEADDAENKELKHSEIGNADALIEILLSFASKPSKFLRRLTTVIFETITSQITRDGLQSLTDILLVKETRAGQQELFEANGDVEMLEEDEDEEGSDVEMLGSDVEIVNPSDEDSSSSEADSNSESSSTSSDSDSNRGDDETDIKDADLLALEASLASALGTRKLTQADMAASSSSDSDSDMTDSEMLALDDKLAEVFRNRAKASNETKKKEAKSARENVVNFKNRVLDMLEIYVRKENMNPHSLYLLMPTLQLARTTQAKQIADRAIRLLETFHKRCAGLERVPTLYPPANIITKPSTSQTPNNTTPSSKKRKLNHLTPPPSDNDPLPLTTATTTTLRLLYDIHLEASLSNTSNAHRQATSRASILVVKSLLKAGVPLADLEAVYTATEKRRDQDPANCHVRDEFFENWRNFLVSVRARFGEGRKSV